MSIFRKLVFKHDKEKKKKSGLPVNIPEVTECFRNPFNEIQLLDFHCNIVKLLLKIDAYRFLSMSDDGQAVVWNIKTGRQMAVIKRQDGRPFSSGVIIHAKTTEEYFFLGACTDKSLEIWDIESGQCVRSICDKQSTIRCLLSLSDGNVICAAGSSLCLWTLEGQLLAALHNTTPEDISGVIPIAGTRLVAQSDTRLYLYSVDSAIHQHGNDSAVLMKILPPHREAITVLENVSENYFVSGSIDGTVILWRTQDMLPARYFNSIKHYEGDFRSYPHSVQCIVSLDQRYLCAAVGNGFCVFDSFNGRTVVEMKHCHQSKVVYLAMVWDNLLLATCSQDGTVRLWGQSSTFDSPPCRGSSSQLYQLLGIGDNETPSWNKEKQPLKLQLIGECAAHSGTVQMLLDYRDDGIVTCGLDSLVILWKNSELESLHRSEKLRDILPELT